MIMLNTPNTLTLIRLGTALPIVLLIIGVFGPQYAPMAILLFALGGALDKLDGVIARRWNQVTEFGAIMDPIVDKIWLHSVNAALLSIGALPLWVFIAFIARDFVVAELRGAARDTQSTRAAHKLGKWKMRTQVLYTLFCMLTALPLHLTAWVSRLLPYASIIMLALALLFTIASLVYYARLYTAHSAPITVSQP